MCYHVQFMDLYRQRFSMHSSDYLRLYTAVQLFVLTEIIEPLLYDDLEQVLLQFPDFRIELAARVNRLTSLFRGGAGNPPPQF